MFAIPLGTARNEPRTVGSSDLPDMLLYEFQKTKESRSDVCTSDWDISDGCTSDWSISDVCTSDKSLTDGCTLERSTSDGCTSDKGISDGCTLDRRLTDGCTLDSQSLKCTYPRGFSGE